MENNRFQFLHETATYRLTLASITHLQQIASYPVVASLNGGYMILVLFCITSLCQGTFKLTCLVTHAVSLLFC